MIVSSCHLESREKSSKKKLMSNICSFFSRKYSYVFFAYSVVWYSFIKCVWFFSTFFFHLFSRVKFWIPVQLDLFLVHPLIPPHRPPLLWLVTRWRWFASQLLVMRLDPPQSCVFGVSPGLINKWLLRRLKPLQTASFRGFRDIYVPLLW